MRLRFISNGSLLTLRAIATLAAVDLRLRCFGFRSLYDTVQRYRPVKADNTIPHLTGKICHAVNRASIFYLNTTTCLQRSAAVVLMLRRFGIDADFVIGCRTMPFASHAWVEVDRTVVNDSTEVSSVYAVVDRL